MNMSQATDKYLAMDQKGKDRTCLAAIKVIPCGFCGAPPGRGCSITLTQRNPLDWFAHCGRWMKYLMEEDMLDILGERRAPDAVASDLTKAGSFDVTGPGAALIDDISDML